jgi:hypothetical protein
MKAVMKEEEQYSAFTDLCCDIYNILRENSALLVGFQTLTYLGIVIITLTLLLVDPFIIFNNLIINAENYEKIY